MEVRNWISPSFPHNFAKSGLPLSVSDFLYLDLSLPVHAHTWLGFSFFALGMTTPGPLLSALDLATLGLILFLQGVSHMGSASLVPEFVNSELPTLIRGATCLGLVLSVPEMVALEFLLSLRGVSCTGPVLLALHSASFGSSLFLHSMARPGIATANIRGCIL